MTNHMIPAQAVEAAERAISELMGTSGPAYTYARAALEAAAPHMLAAAWEEGYMCSYDQERGGSGDGANPAPEHLADDLVQWNPYGTAK